jgi:ribonuclease HI
MMFQKITIYTDGSCLGNPGPGGWAAIILDQDEKKTTSLHGKNYQTTNNRMEIKALIEAIKHLKNSAVNFKLLQLEVYSDSNLLVQTLTKGWKRKKNLDLWNELDQLKNGIKINFHWVKAHALNRYNNEVDLMALKEAKQAQKQVEKNPDLIEENPQKKLF